MLRDAKTLFNAHGHSQDSVVLMANEEKYRTETPEEEEAPAEKKGLLRPLPSEEVKEEPKYFDKHGRPQPTVRLLGVSMPEKRKVVTTNWPNSATFLFFIPIIVSIPIGLTSSDVGSALIGGFLGTIFFVIIFISFLATPAIIAPELGISTFIISGIMLSIGYFILMTMATLLGAIIGALIREFF